MVYRFGSAVDAMAKADEIGGSRFLMVDPGGKYKRIDKVDGAWGHEDGKEFTVQGLMTGPNKNSEDVHDRQYLAVPYGERTLAKAAGALWDPAAKSWYAGPKADTGKLERWHPEKFAGSQDPAMSPREEFTEAMLALGCIVSGEHPILDGQKHRISVEGDKNGEKAGSYVCHLDDHPAGCIKNFRTGVDVRWKSKGYSLNPEEVENLKAHVAAKQAERKARMEKLYESAAQRISQQMESLVPVAEATPYMRSKGILPYAGALTDGEYKTTYIPAHDVDGKIWTMQYIQEDGKKRFAKNSRKEGCFHPVGGMQALASAPVLIIAEGYATAATLAEATGLPMVSAFDSGNLLPVAQALHQKYPGKSIIIAGDDDLNVGKTLGINPGRVKATEAARAVGGKALFPIFAPGEQSAESKDFTDFNDLAHSSRLGMDGVKRQIQPVIEKVVREMERRESETQKLEVIAKKELKKSSQRTPQRSISKSL